MSGEVERWVSRIRQEILAHIENHPHASDTTDGIAQWWLTTTASAPLALVDIALDRLVAEGRMHRITGPDGVVRFSAWPPAGPS